MTGTPHTATYRGKRVLVRLKSGERFVDHFHDRTKKMVFFKSGRRVLRGDIKSFSIYKGFDAHANIN